MFAYMIKSLRNQVRTPRLGFEGKLHILLETAMFAVPCYIPGGRIGGEGDGALTTFDIKSG